MLPSAIYFLIQSYTKTIFPFFLLFASSLFSAGCRLVCGCCLASSLSCVSHWCSCMCQVQNILVEHAFEISSFLFFVGPMTLICVLYVLIGIKLRSSKSLQGMKRASYEMSRSICGQTRIIRMLSKWFFFMFVPY